MNYGMIGIINLLWFDCEEVFVRWIYLFYYKLPLWWNILVMGLRSTSVLSLMVCVVNNETLPALKALSICSLAFGCKILGCGNCLSFDI